MAGITTCDKSSVDVLRNRLRDIYRIIDTYRWIIEAYVSDFYVKSHWEKLPSSWQHYLGQLDFVQLSHLLSGKPWCRPAENGCLSPLSLLALKACCNHLAQTRRCVELDDADTIISITRTLGSRGSQQRSSQSVRCAESGIQKKLGFKNGQLMDMEHIFRKHVKPKKQHEIQQLGKVVSLVSGNTGCDRVVDVGAGLGHLSRLLTFAHGLKVTTVEASGGHAPKASEFDRELKKDIQKKLKKNESAATSYQEKTTAVSPCDLPCHVVCTVQPDITTDEFLRLVMNRDSVESDTKDTPDHRTHHLSRSKESSDSVMAAPAVDKSVAMVPGEASSVTSHGAVASKGDSGNSLHQCGAMRPCSVNQQASRLLCVETASDVRRNEVVGSARDGTASSSPAVWSQSPDEREPAVVTQAVELMQAVEGMEEESLLGSGVCSVNRPDGRSYSIHGQDSHSCSIQRQPAAGVESACNGPGLCSTDSGDSAAKHHFNSDGDVDRNSGENASKHHLHGDCDTDRNKHSDTASKRRRRRSEGQGELEGVGGEAEVNGLVLAGLHACGDLTATLLRVFLNCPAVTALVSVGCCYMKLSDLGNGDEGRGTERGYPMSDFVASIPTHPLNYEAREMACHFADAYASRLQEGSPHLRIHSYRAAVQHIVTQTRPDFRHGATRLVVKKGAEIPFEQYASQCLRRLGIDQSEVGEGVVKRAESLTDSWRDVVAFYTLRLSLAPLVETAVLLDRMVFLYEHGVSSVLVPVFDSTVSPRNFALLACKPGH